MIEHVDFSICPFIKEQMWFFTYYDFCDNRKVLKKMYQELTKEAKQMYKWYVYANIHISLNRKNLMWSYLNDDISYETLVRLGNSGNKSQKLTK